MPDGWQETTLGEFCGLEIGRTPPRKEAHYWTDSGERPFCTIADMDSKVVFQGREGVTELAEMNQKARRVPAGSLLMSFKLTIGRVAFAGRDLFPNEAIVAISPDESRASREFLYLNLGSRDLTEGSGQAVKGKTLNSTSLRQIAVHLPPLAEQRRIVDLVGSIDTYIDSLETQTETTRTARSALLSELLSNRGDDWQEVRIGDVAEVLGGKRLPKGTPWSATPTGRRYIRSVDINEGKIDTSALVWVPEDVMPIIEKYRVSSGDVLITIAGKIGQTAVVLPALDGENLTENAALIRIFGEGIAPEFLHLWLSSAAGQASIEEVTVGTSQRKLALVRIKDLHVQVPSNLDQSRILGLVGSIDEQVSSLESQVESVRSFRSGVLSELLSGERLLDDSYDVAVGL